MFSANSGWPKK